MSKSRRRLGNKSYAKTSQERELKGEARLADVDRFLHCLVLREHKSLKLDLLVELYQRQGQAYLENYTEDKMKENHRKL